MFLLRSARSTTRLLVSFLVGFVVLTLFLTAHSDERPSPLSSVSTKIPTWNPPFRIPSIGLGSNSKNKKRVLVTGGSGVIGLPLIKRLISDGYDVTLLDSQAPTSSDLQYLSDHSVPSFDISSFASSNPSSSRSRPGKLILADVDIRRYKPLRNVFKRSEQFDGIVHLAGVARNTWCTERETECADLNVNGTKRVFDAAMESAKGKAPWFIYLSSIDVYGYKGELGSGTMNVLGKTKWATQQALRTAHDTAIEQGKSPRTAVLRLATTFGSPKEFKDRLLPAVVGRAMGEMPLQIMDADERIDLMRIEDALEGIMGAVNMLQGGGRSESVADLDSVMEQGQMTEREESPLANAGDGYWDEFDLVSGSTISPNELVNIVMAATSSSSPIQDFSLTREKAGPYRRVTPPVDSRAETILGFTARIPVEIGLAAYIHEQQAAFIDWATGYMRRNCPESAKYGNKAAVHRADIRNKEMDRLMGCTINMGVNHKGWVHHMKCGEKDGISCQADNIKRDSYNWNQTVFTVVPPYKGSISPLAADLAENNLKPHRRATKGPLVVQFEEELTKMVLGFRRKKGGAAASTAPIKFKLFTKEEALASEIVTEFEPRVQANASYLQLVVAGTNEYIQITPEVTTTQFELAKLTPQAPHDVRMTLLCCPTDQPWPLLLDDYEAADIKYGFTGDIPFDSSLRKHECKRVEAALDFTQEKKKSLGHANSDIEMHEEFSVDLSQKILSVDTTIRPHEWKDRDYPVCMNDCSSPNICVQNGRCRCIQADECEARERNPIAPVAVSAHSRLIKITTHDDFVKAVGKISWKDLLLPEAKRVIDEYPHFIKVHVVSGYEGEEEIEANDCHKLGDNHCFSADSIMYQAMRRISVPADEADLIILPAYQQCVGGSFLLHTIYHHADKTIPNFDWRPKTVILTHDWGICINFAWNIWAGKEDNHLAPDYILDNTVVWSVQGDSNTKCYRPHQDVVIPARTCNSIKLKEVFGSVSEITPSAQRNMLITWSGTHWGTGKTTRLRLVCQRGDAGARELVPNAGPQSRWFDWDYMEQLSHARFCPQPTGIAGWSFRVQDAIYAGCIPVFLADGTHYPFADILDWAKFSVRLSPTDLDHIEEILREIPIEKVEEMQANLVAIREAFIYSPDESPEDELTRQGPLFFALHSARIRLATRYPVAAKKKTVPQ